MLLLESLQSARCDVVLDSRGSGVVSLRLSRKSFSHSGTKGFQEVDSVTPVGSDQYAKASPVSGVRFFFTEKFLSQDPEKKIQDKEQHQTEHDRQFALVAARSSLSLYHGMGNGKMNGR